MTNQAPELIQKTAGYVSSAADYIFAQSPPVIAFVGCLAVGYLCKSIPVFPNKWIPVLVLLTGVIVYPLIELPGRCGPSVASPKVVFGIVGLVIGCGAWVFHAKVLKKLVDERFFKRDDDGNTKLFVRKDNEKS